MRLGFILAMIVLSAASAWGQSPPPKHPEYGPHDTVTVYATLLDDGTLIPTGALPDVEVVGKMPARLAKKIKAWNRLRNAVYVTYPYALQASIVINDINTNLAALPERSAERKAYIKLREKDLKANFADKIVNLSVYQGKVLMKLINRETGSNCYDILEEYKGGVNARLWQALAFVFGSSLKQPYDPRSGDAEIEKIVQELAVLYGRS